MSQVAAIEANEKESSEISQDATPATSEEEKANPMVAWMSGAISFEELEQFESGRELQREARDLVSSFGEMAHNVLTSGQPPKDKGTMFDNLVKGLQKRLKGLFGQMGKKSVMDDNQTGILFWKGKDGDYRWVAKYSNNLRDNDQPAEIISQKSHRDFVARVESAESDLPALYIWHEKSLEIGKADWVAMDETPLGVVFALAGGKVSKQHADVVDFVSALPPEEVGLSHGMPFGSIRRDENDPTVIVRHDSKEISILPMWAAANKHTAFAVLKEESMSIPTDKREHILNWGISPETLARIESGNVAEADEAAKDTEFKESNTPENTQMSEEETPETPVVEDEAEEEDKGTSAPIQEDQKASPVLTLETLEIALTDVLKQVNASWEARFDELKAEVAEAQKPAEEEEEEKPTDKGIPAASLGARIALSIIGDEKARVDGRKSLAKDGPEETQPNGAGPTTIPFINDILEGKSTA
jgi:hypothetical protein